MTKEMRSAHKAMRSGCRHAGVVRSRRPGDRAGVGAEGSGNRRIELRQESASCSEMVLLPAFKKSAALPEGKTVPVEFLPTEPGEYEFACQMGMFRGKVGVE